MKRNLIVEYWPLANIRMGMRMRTNHDNNTNEMNGKWYSASVQSMNENQIVFCNNLTIWWLADCLTIDLSVHKNRIYAWKKAFMVWTKWFTLFKCVVCIFVVCLFVFFGTAIILHTRRKQQTSFSFNHTNECQWVDGCVLMCIFVCLLICDQFIRCFNVRIPSKFMWWILVSMEGKFNTFSTIDNNIWPFKCYTFYSNHPWIIRFIKARK